MPARKSTSGVNGGVGICGNNDVTLQSKQQRLIVNPCGDFYIGTKEPFQAFQIDDDRVRCGVFHSWRKTCRTIQQGRVRRIFLRGGTQANDDLGNMLKAQASHSQLDPCSYCGRVCLHDFLQSRGIAIAIDHRDGFAQQFRLATGERLNSKMRDKNCSEHLKLSGLNGYGQFLPS